MPGGQSRSPKAPCAKGTASSASADAAMTGKAEAMSMRLQLRKEKGGKEKEEG